jgi:hypothetical protein
MIEQLPLLDKRWNRRRAVFVPPTDRIDPSAYHVQPIATAAARAFVTEHHYSAVFVAARANVGLFRESRLVGVATFSHPMSDKVLTKYLGHRDGCELGRFVLLDSEPFNSESWFLARALRILRVEKPTLRGVVSFADPMERRDAAGQVTKPQHFGQIYRATNATFAGRSSVRSLIVAPNGVSLSPRALSKIRGAEQGREYAQRQLEVAGVSPRRPAESGAAWLRRIDGELARVAHPGNLAFTFAL